MRRNGRPPPEKPGMGHWGWAIRLALLLSAVLWGCIVVLILWASGVVG